jgi:hypothetical protein
LTDNTYKLQGEINIPFHGIQGIQGKSAYDIACENGFVGTQKEWLSSLGIPEGTLLSGGWCWDPESDSVTSADGTVCTLKDLEDPSLSGRLVKVCGDGKFVAFDKDKYSISGSNGFLNVGDAVVYADNSWYRIGFFEAKASTVKNSDGKYSPQSGVDGLFSSTQAAYLTDLIDSYWGIDSLRVFPAASGGHMVNWCRDTGVYVGGLKSNCGGHPPVLNNNQASWLLMVFNSISTNATDTSYNHRMQIAIDLVNSRIYLRRGWISSNEWSEWVDSALVQDESITESKLSADLKKRITNSESEISALSSRMSGVTFSFDEDNHLTAEIS